MLGWEGGSGSTAVLAGAAMPGQEGNDGRLKKDVTINMLLGWACGKVRGGGGMASATVDLVGQRRGEGCGNR